MASFLDSAGAQHQVTPSLEWYQAAAAANMSLEQWVNTEYQTDANTHGSAYHQILASEGIVLKPNKVYGLRSNTMAQIEKGAAVNAAALVKDSDFSSAALRVLFPSAVLSAVEDRLTADLNMTANAFDRLVAFNDVIQGDKYERPLLNYSKPESARSQAVAQLAEPNVMLSITAASYSRTIPTLSIGMLVAQQAAQNTTLDLVAMALARQVATERMLRAREYFLLMLNGDPDLKGEGPGSGTISAIIEARQSGSTQMVNIDSAATTGITQKGWMKWLYREGTRRVIDWVVTDMDGALALENRAGKPVVVGDNPTSTRIDSVLNVGNPTWRSNVNVFITDDPAWPAKTVLGFDSRYAIARVTSSTIQYSAVEEYVMRRAKGLRIDFGEIAYRLHDDAFDVFTYA